MKGELGRHLNAFYVQLSTILLYVAVTQRDKVLLVLIMIHFVSHSY